MTCCAPHAAGTVDGAEAELQAAARGPLAWEDPLDEDGPASPFWAEAPMLDAEAAPRGVPPLAKVIEEAGVRLATAGVSFVVSAGNSTRARQTSRR